MKDKEAKTAMPILINAKPTFTKAPDMAGMTGRAWRISMPPIGKRAYPAHDAALNAWLIHDATLIAGPMWEWWTVQAIHLRPMAGVKPAHIRVPGAEHEIMTVALAPECYATLDPDNPKSVHVPLTPIDLQHQVVGLTDERAMVLCDSVVRAIVLGREVPDHCASQRWAGLMEATIAHIKTGAHDPH